MVYGLTPNNGWGSSTFDSTVGDMDISGKIPTGQDVFGCFSRMNQHGNVILVMVILAQQQ